ncbi:sialoadhesin-like [Pristis pectinata]|uniref:sialoadhesin-like n=1 Tax=Pristis pectinata TaxID=685728 RepID=UPI00223DD49E|nr:sialoadhesin-like [Pristis pectinata]
MIRKSVFLLSLLQGVLSEWSLRALPQRAISRSCVVIPCTFDFPSHPHTAIHGAWFKYWYYWKYTVYYSKDPNYAMSNFKGRAKIIGNLGKKDCSLRIDNVRPEDSDVYYFYVELDGFTTHSYTSPIQLQVLEVPDRPEILLPGNLTEGTPVTIVCKAIYTCPENRPSLTWSELPNSTVNVFAENSSGEISSVLAFTPSFVHHSGTVRCTVDYSGTSHRLENSVTLNVTYSPKKTVVQWTLNKDNGISLSCSSEANPNVTHFSWFKTSGGAETELRQYGDTITVACGSEEEAVSFYCRATNAVGSSRSPSVRIPNQREAAILPSSQCTRYPTNVTCHCMVQSCFPVNVSWGFLGRTVQNSETEGGYLTQCVRAGILVTNTLTIRGDNLTLETVSCSVANPRGLPPSQMKLEVVADDGQGHGASSPVEEPAAEVARYTCAPQVVVL